MNNKEFANLLAMAAKNGKLTKGKLVENFIKKFDGSASDGNVGDLDTKEVTPEISKFVKDVKSRRMKIKDHQLESIFTYIAINHPVEAVKVATDDWSGYVAQEW